MGFFSPLHLVSFWKKKKIIKKERSTHSSVKSRTGRRNDRQAPQPNGARLSWRTPVPTWVSEEHRLLTYHRCWTRTPRAVNSFAKAICTRGGVFTPSDEQMSFGWGCCSLALCCQPSSMQHGQGLQGLSSAFTTHLKKNKTKHTTPQVATYLPGWRRWGCGCRIFWWWYRWTAAWWVSCPGGGCSSETQASGAVDCGAGPSARWLCSSPSNGQTPCETAQEHNRGEASSPGGQGEPPRAGKEDGEGDNPVGHPHMDTHLKPRGWREGKGEEERKSETLLHNEDTL